MNNFSKFLHINLCSTLNILSSYEIGTICCIGPRGGARISFQESKIFKLLNSKLIICTYKKPFKINT